MQLTKLVPVGAREHDGEAFCDLGANLLRGGLRKHFGGRGEWGL